MASQLRVDKIVPTNGVPTGGGGAIIQIKQAVFTGTQTHTSGTWTDITDLSVTLTPHFTDSKLWITGSVLMGGYADAAPNIRIDVNGTNNTTGSVGAAAGSRTPVHTGFSYYYIDNTTGTADTYTMFAFPISWIHSPNSTSAQTVKLQQANIDVSGVTQYINRTNQDNNAVWGATAMSSLTVAEISGGS